MYYTSTDITQIRNRLSDLFFQFNKEGKTEIDDDLREECIQKLEELANDYSQEYIVGDTFYVVNWIKNCIDDAKYTKARKLLSILAELENNHEDTDYRVWYQPSKNCIYPLEDEMIDEAYLQYVQDHKGD